MESALFAHVCSHFFCTPGPPYCFVFSLAMIESELKWTHSGEKLTEVDFSFWKSGQPKIDDNVNCVIMGSCEEGESQYYWRTADCAETNSSALCERNLESMGEESGQSIC